jgi:hypothetical protein
MAPPSTSVSRRVRLSDECELLELSFGFTDGVALGAPFTPPMFTSGVVGSSVVPEVCVFTGRAEGCRVRRVVGAAVFVGVDVGRGVADGVWDGTTGGGVVGTTQPSGGHVGVGDGSGRSVVEGTGVGDAAGAAVAVVPGRRSAPARARVPITPAARPRTRPPEIGTQAS